MAENDMAKEKSAMICDNLVSQCSTEILAPINQHISANKILKKKKCLEAERQYRR